MVLAAPVDDGGSPVAGRSQPSVQESSTTSGCVELLLEVLSYA